MGVGGDTVTIGSTGTASASAVKYQRVSVNGTYTTIDGTMYMVINNKSSTSYVFNNTNIKTTSDITVKVSIWGDNPSNVTVIAGKCTVTFSNAQTRSVKIYIRNN